MTILNLSEALRESLAKRRFTCHLPAMFKKILPVLLVALLGCQSLLLAQQNQPTDNNTNDTPQKNRFWQASVGGGHYMVALDRISAISRHKYVLDGAVIVDEVTVDALGQSLARFYFISPISDEMGGNAAGEAASRLGNRARELVEGAAGRAGTDIHNMVVKKFPETTHAKEIEFRILSEEQLTALYNSVRTAWESGRGRKYAEK
jgi:hypothetical protein